MLDAAPEPASSATRERENGSHRRSSCGRGSTAGRARRGPGRTRISRGTAAARRPSVGDREGDKLAQGAGCERGGLKPASIGRGSRTAIRGPRSFGVLAHGSNGEIIDASTFLPIDLNRQNATGSGGRQQPQNAAGRALVGELGGGADTPGSATEPAAILGMT